MIALTSILTFALLTLQEPAAAPTSAPADAPPPTEALPLEAPPEQAPHEAPPPAPELGPAPVAVAPPSVTTVAPMMPPPQRRFVIAFLPSILMGISPLPSQNLALFLGARLKRSPWALGYQFTFSNGFADRYYKGLLAHRHHIMALRSFGARDRGFTSVAGGAAFLGWNPVVEVEGRSGLRWGSRRYGVVGALVRVGWDVGHRERAPMPQLGLFFGIAVF